VVDWFENDDLWVELYSLLFPEERWEMAGPEVECILALAEKPVKDALDLACGPGRHAIALAERGVRVTALDRTQFYLDKAKDRSEKEGVEVEWVESDMRDFVRPGAYDLVLSMFTSFGYYEDEADNLSLLDQSYENLRDGGMLIIDMVGKECLAANFQETALSEETDGTILVQRRRIREGWDRIENEWILIQGDDAKTFRFAHSIYSGVEIKDRLEQRGFREVRLLSNLDGSPYGWGARRLVVVAWK
jgi:SAM-dependent methyltransferase